MLRKIKRLASRQFELVDANGEVYDLGPAHPEHQNINALFDQLVTDTLVHVGIRDAAGWQASRVSFHQEGDGPLSVNIRLDKNPSVDANGEDTADEVKHTDLTPIGEFDESTQKRLNELHDRATSAIAPPVAPAPAGKKEEEGDGGDGDDDTGEDEAGDSRVDGAGDGDQEGEGEGEQAADGEGDQSGDAGSDGADAKPGAQSSEESKSSRRGRSGRKS